jgi:mono/diheme cytochrome c family protein
MRDAATIWHRMPLTLVLCAALGPATAAYAAGIDNQSFDQVERGRYLSIVGDCAACHTLPGSGHALAGGRVLETPFGSLLSPNITPEAVTGIGAWTDDEFVNSMTKGTGRNGAHLFPAMPYTYYTKISRDDALAIRAYLNTLPPVHNEVRPDQLPFPLNVRENMVAWDRLFFRPGEFRPDASKSAEWNRGAYLTEGLGHCGLCHTPKGELGGDERDRAMQGYALQGWFAADLTNDRRRGLGSWSVDDIATYLKSGRNKFASATGLMAETINNSTSKMSDADLHAMATYLKDRPGDPANAAQNRTEGLAPPPAPPSSVMKVGQQIYADECAGCHKADGKGAPGLFPALAGVPLVQQSDPASLLHVVLRGTMGLATAQAPTAAAMPAFAWVLNDEQVAAVLTYIRNSWGNTAPAVAAGDAGKARSALAKRND